MPKFPLQLMILPASSAVAAAAGAAEEQSRNAAVGAQQVERMEIRLAELPEGAANQSEVPQAEPVGAL